jgi:hypothetical protein
MKTINNFSSIILTSFISILGFSGCEKEEVYNEPTAQSATPAANTASVSTYSGGTKGYVDGPIDKAKFLAPSKIVVGPDGSLFIADFNKIRKINPNGIVSTFAGCRASDVAVDGTGLDASFAFIASMTISPDGNLFVTDMQKNPYLGPPIVGRKITPERVVTTDEYHKMDVEYRMSNPGSLEYAFDSTMYLVDNNSTGSTIVKLRSISMILLQTYIFSYVIKSLAVGPDGALYILTDENELLKRMFEKIWKIIPASPSVANLTSSKISAVPSTTQNNAPSASLDYLDIAKDGTIYITDGIKIWKISTDGTVSLLAGGEPGYANGPALEAKFEKINSIALAENDSVLYVSDKFRIRKIAF